MPTTTNVIGTIEKDRNPLRALLILNASCNNGGGTVAPPKPAKSFL